MKETAPPPAAVSYTRIATPPRRTRADLERMDAAEAKRARKRAKALQARDHGGAVGITNKKGIEP